MKTHKFDELLEMRSKATSEAEWNSYTDQLKGHISFMFSDPNLYVYLYDSIPSSAKLSNEVDLMEMITRRL